MTTSIPTPVPPSENPTPLPILVDVLCDAAFRNGKSTGGIHIIFLNSDRPPHRLNGNVYASTNNEAEYIIVVNSIKVCLKLDYKPVHFYSDSQLVVRQVSGQYLCKKDHLLPHRDFIRVNLGDAQLIWLPREKMTAADKLANQAM